MLQPSPHVSTGLQFVGGTSGPMHSLPFGGPEVWSEESVLHYPRSHVISQLQAWLGTTFDGAWLSSLVPHCCGAMEWLDADSCFCLPVVVCLPDVFSMPSSMQIWGLKRVAAALRCSQTVVTQWLADVRFFVEGKRIPCLPPQDDSLEKTASSKR